MGRRARGEGALYQRKDGLWVAESKVGGKKKYLYGRTKKAAFQKKKDYEQEINKPVVTRSEITVEAFLKDWLSSVEGTVKDRTYQRHEEVVRLHLGSLYDKYLYEVQATDLQEIYKTKGRTLSPRSVQLIHRTISQALKQAVKQNLVEKNVANDVTPPRTEQKEIRTLTKEEVNRLLSKVEGRRFEIVYVLAVTAGMREGEIFGLKWGDIDLSRKVLRVRRTLWKGETSAPKSKSSIRTVPLSDSANEVLEQYRRFCEEGRFPLSEWLISTSTGRPVSCHNFLNRSWYPLLEEMGLERIPFHNLRHTTATLLLGKGIHPKLVQNLLGHANIEVTLNTYSHVLPEMGNLVAEAMDEVLDADEDTRSDL